MNPTLRPFSNHKECNLLDFGDVPERWGLMRLRTLVEMRVSNVDKHTSENEIAVRLCNYVDVYKNDHISRDMPFMRATASKEEIDRFRLHKHDVLITKDSETWNDIGVPALVTEPADDLISGYHLALLRPKRDILGPFLFRTLQGRGIAHQFHIAANGVTRYGLTHNGIQSVVLPVPPLDEQVAIVRYLDDADHRIRAYVSAKERLITLLEEERQARHPPSSYKRPRPQRETEALRREVAGRRAGTLGNVQESSNSAIRIPRTRIRTSRISGRSAISRPQAYGVIPRKRTVRADVFGRIEG